MPVWYSLGGGADNLKPDDIYDPSNANCKSHERKKTIGSDALLTGLIFDDRGNTMSPVKSRRRGGRFYLYYVSQARIQRRDPDGMRPVPAPAVEEIVRDRLSCIIGLSKQSSRGGSKPSPDELSESSLRERIREFVLRVVAGDSRVTVTFNANAIVALAGNSLTQIVTALRAWLPAEDNFDADSESIILTVPVRLRLRGGIKRVEGWDQSNWVLANSRHDPALIKALAQAHEWRGWIEEGTAVTLEDVATRSSHDRKYSHKVLKLAFLAPDIQRAILTGRQHKSLTLAALTETDPPLLWADQRTFALHGLSG